MHRWSEVFGLSVVLLLFSLPVCHAQDEPVSVISQMAAELQDSISSGKYHEPTLQQVLDGLGYNIDVVNDRLPTEAWARIAGQYSEIMLAELAEYSGTTASGWYKAGVPSDTHVVFRGWNSPRDSAHFYITGCDSNGLFIAPFAGEKCHYVYYTEKRFNPDHKDHAWVYCSKKRPNEFIVAWEDEYDLGDQDFQDLVLLYRMPDRPPVLSVPHDTSFSQCLPDSIRFDHITAYDPDCCGDTVVITKIQGPGIYSAGKCRFLPAAVDSVYRFVFVATDWLGAADTDNVVITVNIDDPPQLACPGGDSVHSGNKFVSRDFSVTDPEGDAAPVTLLSITPPSANNPSIVANHLEWNTTCSDKGNYVIRLVATDPCGAKDTCQFSVKVYNQPPQLTCPNASSIDAGQTFVSTNFSVTDPEGDPTSVALLDVSPPGVTNQPAIVGTHVEWITTASETGDYTIRLVAADACGLKDTCEFTVTVLSVPTGGLSCPDDDSVHAGDKFVSSDFSISGPGTNPDSVRIIGISPSPTNQPTRSGLHVEWRTGCDDVGKVFTICLGAMRNTGVKDTCCFHVTVYNRPPQLICPNSGHTNAGETFVSSNFSVSDPDGGQPSVEILDIQPQPDQNAPTIVGGHVEWKTSLLDEGDYTVRLVATDGCGAKDTCQFTMSIYNCHNPNFVISASPDTQLVSAGHGVGYLVSLISFWGLHDACTLFVAGVPNPSGSAIFDRALLHPTDSTILNIYTSPTTPEGFYTLTIGARNFGQGADYVEHSTTVVLQVLEPGDAGDWADNPAAPKTFTLFPNQPNPFNPETRISYYLPAPCQVKVTIYNLLGQNVRTLSAGRQEAGMRTLTWNGRDNNGLQLSSGVYFCRLQADNFIQTNKMVLMK
ncbi:MAG: FlgD immunoglobulin-like domain containing protein [Candidatus Zixiibacteriota bacterium]